MYREELEEFLSAHLEKNIYEKALELLKKAIDEACANAELGNY